MLVTKTAKTVTNIDSANFLNRSAGNFADLSKLFLIRRNFKVKSKLQNDENRKEISHIFVI